MPSPVLLSMTHISERGSFVARSKTSLFTVLKSLAFNVLNGSRDCPFLASDDRVSASVKNGSTRGQIIHNFGVVHRFRQEIRYCTCGRADISSSHTPVTCCDRENPQVRCCHLMYLC